MLSSAATGINALTPLHARLIWLPCLPLHACSARPAYSQQRWWVSALLTGDAQGEHMDDDEGYEDEDDGGNDGDYY